MYRAVSGSLRKTIEARGSKTKERPVKGQARAHSLKALGIAGKQRLIGCGERI